MTSEEIAPQLLAARVLHGSPLLPILFLFCNALLLAALRLLDLRLFCLRLCKRHKPIDLQ